MVQSRCHYKNKTCNGQRRPVCTLISPMCLKSSGELVVEFYSITVIAVWRLKVAFPSSPWMIRLAFLDSILYSSCLCSEWRQSLYKPSFTVTLDCHNAYSLASSNFESECITMYCIKVKGVIMIVTSSVWRQTDPECVGIIRENSR